MEALLQFSGVRLLEVCTENTRFDARVLNVDHVQG